MLGTDPCPIDPAIPTIAPCRVLTHVTLIPPCPDRRSHHARTDYRTKLTRLAVNRHSVFGTLQCHLPQPFRKKKTHLPPQNLRSCPFPRHPQPRPRPTPLLYSPSTPHSLRPPSSFRRINHYKNTFSSFLFFGLENSVFFSGFLITS